MQFVKVKADDYSIKNNNNRVKNLKLFSRIENVIFD